MSKSAINLSCLVIILVTFSLIGCAGGNRGILNIVQKPTENELRRDWKEYTVYYRLGLAYVYKIKNDRKIILNNSWVDISSEDMMAKSPMMGSGSSWVKEIIGNNDEMLGYLVHRYQDVANIKIINENTVQLYYHYVRTSR